jgi:hypothetical protein
MAAGSTEAMFHNEMMPIYDRAKRECGYNATRFLQLVTENGGLNAAKTLLRSSALSDGLVELWKHKRLDLTMEALILRPPWRSLFTNEELATADTRLRDLGYSPADD